MNETYPSVIIGLLNQIDEEMPFLPVKWDDMDIIAFALKYILANTDDVEEYLTEVME